MGHEDAVYLAKLAEQAERYEGGCPNLVLEHRYCGQHWNRESLTTRAAQRWLRT